MDQSLTGRCAAGPKQHHAVHRQTGTVVETGGPLVRVNRQMFDVHGPGDVDEGSDEVATDTRIPVLRVHVDSLNVRRSPSQLTRTGNTIGDDQEPEPDHHVVGIQHDSAVMAVCVLGVPANEVRGEALPAGELAHLRTCRQIEAHIGYGNQMPLRRFRNPNVSHLAMVPHLPANGSAARIRRPAS